MDSELRALCPPLHAAAIAPGIVEVSSEADIESYTVTNDARPGRATGTAARCGAAREPALLHSSARCQRP